MVYPALLPLMRTPRLPAVDWTDAPRRFKWTRPFRRKTKSVFCACAITFQKQSTTWCVGQPCKCHSWHHFYRTGKFLWYYTWPILHNVDFWLSWILAAVQHLAVYVKNLAMLTDWTVIQFLCRTPRGGEVFSNKQNSEVCHPLCV